MILKNRRLKKVHIVVLSIVIAVVFIVLNTFRVNERKKKNFKLFNNSELRGTITYVRSSSQGSEFRLANSENLYSFLPVTNSLNNNTSFNTIAKKGDSIFKPGNSDTLTLIKGNRRYLYTFYKSH